MKESFWGYAIIVLGVLAITFIFFFANVTNTDQQNYNLLKESVEAAMFDAIDLSEYRASGTVKMNKEKFIENFIRRYAENALLSKKYVIEIYDVNETPPKVSLKVSTLEKSAAISNGEQVDFELDLVNRIDAILETPY